MQDSLPPLAFRRTRRRCQEPKTLQRSYRQTPRSVSVVSFTLILLGPLSSICWRREIIHFDCMIRFLVPDRINWNNAKSRVWRWVLLTCFCLIRPVIAQEMNTDYGRTES